MSGFVFERTTLPVCPCICGEREGDYHHELFTARERGGCTGACIVHDFSEDIWLGMFERRDYTSRSALAREPYEMSYRTPIIFAIEVYGHVISDARMMERLLHVCLWGCVTCGLTPYSDY